MAEQRAGFVALIGEQHIFWDAAAAINYVHDRIAVSGCQGCTDCPVVTAGDTKTHPPAE